MTPTLIPRGSEFGGTSGPPSTRSLAVSTMQLHVARPAWHGSCRHLRLAFFESAGGETHFSTAYDRPCAGHALLTDAMDMSPAGATVREACRALHRHGMRRLAWDARA